jgi:hypothetical protein
LYSYEERIQKIKSSKYITSGNNQYHGENKSGYWDRMGSAQGGVTGALLFLS